MPLNDEQVPELHGKMPNVTSETVEKTTVVFGGFIGGFTATLGCYCHTCGPHQQQTHLPTAKHHATEGRTSARIAPKDA